MCEGVRYVCEGVTAETVIFSLTSAAVNLSRGPPNTRSFIPDKCSRVMSSCCRDTVQCTFSRDCGETTSLGHHNAVSQARLLHEQ